MAGGIAIDTGEDASRDAPADPYGDRVLIAALKKGGEARRRAVEALYRCHARRFFRYFTAHRVAETEAQDLVQEVFVKAVRACGEFRGDSRPDTWLWAIARNCLISHFRARRAQPLPLDEEDLDRIVEARPELQERPAHESAGRADDCVAEGLARFRAACPERGHVLTLLVMDEWSIEQIARFLGRTPGATREYLSQCRKKLKPFIEHCLELLAA